MLNSVVFAFIVACVLGFLAGLGVGGGSLLILWLTLILGFDHDYARIINLLFFIPTAVISSLFHWKQGVLEWKKIIPAVVLGCIAAGICSRLSHQMELSLIKKFFGILLIAAGFRELFYKCKIPR